MSGEVRNWGGISAEGVSALIHSQKVLGDSQIRDNTEAQIITIRVSLDLNTATRNTITLL